MLARGKYVHSIVFHEVKPDKVDEYTELVGTWYPKMASIPENKVHLVGSWRTEVGDCNTFGKLPVVTVVASGALLTLHDQYTSGSISGTKAITNRYTTFKAMPNSQTLTLS